MPRALFLLFAVLFVLPAAAQVPAYHRAADAPRLYREVTRGTGALQTPDGPLALATFHDAHIEVRFTAPDTASATYRALTISMEAAGNRLAPDTAPVLGDPFVLYFPADGAVEVASTPIFPESFAGVSDLRHQFDDFFLPLPDAPLRHGLVWTRTATDPLDGGVRTTETRYEVVGDTVVAGFEALIVAAHAQHTLSSTSPGPAPGITVVSELAGTDDGFFYFAPRDGVLVGRQRVGMLSGEIRYEGGPQPLVIPHTMRHENSIELLPR